MRNKIMIDFRCHVKMTMSVITEITMIKFLSRFHASNVSSIISYTRYQYFPQAQSHELRSSSIRSDDSMVSSRRNFTNMA